jgi:hypothetical protein
MQVMFPAATLTAITADEFTANVLKVNQGDANVDSVFGTGDDTSGGSHPFSSGNKNWWTGRTSSNPVAGWTTDTYYPVLYAYDGTTATVSIDGSPLFSYAQSFAGGPDLVGITVGGAESNSTSGEIYFIADVRVGTTPGGTDIFADDFSGDLSAWTVVGDATIGGGGPPSGPTNIDQASATALVGDCSEATVSNSGAPDTAEADDPLNTVYSVGEPFSRQVWWKLTNTSGSQAYARFILKNMTGAPIDIAAAVYVDDPAAIPIDPNRSFDNVVDWQTPLGNLGTIVLGTAIEAGATVWLEIAGDDTEGDGDGWNGNLDLTWELLAASFKDTPDAGMQGGTEYRGDLQGVTRVGGLPIPTSYCKCGDLHFAAINQAGGTSPEDTDLHVWVWSDSGGAATDYDMFLVSSGLLSNSEHPTGTGVPLLRTDGTNVWLICYEVHAPESVTCNGTEHEKGTTISPTILVWNGSGFTFLGSDPAKTFPWSFDSSGINYDQFVGQLTAAASSAEVGVLHVMWAEEGPFVIDPLTCDVSTFLGRIGYSQWSPTAPIITFTDSFSSDIGVPTATQHLFATNAFGSLKAFYGPPATIDLELDHTAITYGTTVQMWSIDESTGASTVLQTIDGAALNPAVSQLDASSSQTIGGTRLPPQETYGGVDTIFFVAPWRELSGPAFYAPLLFVPADGSNPIATVPASIAGVDGISPSGSIQDAYDDGTSIWVGTGSIGAAGNAIMSGSLTCTRGESGYIADGDGVRYITPGGIEFQYDSSADCFYTLGMNAATQQSTTEYAPLKIPILRDYLICSISTCVGSDGLYAWQRF